MQRPILSRGTVALAGLAVAALAGALVLALKTPKTADPIVTSGLPDPPASVQATAQSASSITVSWPLVANAQSYQVITRRGNTNIDFANVKAPTQQLVTKGLMPSTLYCFEVVSMRGKQASAATRPVCQRTGAATPSSGSSPASSSSASSSGGAGAGPGGAGGPGASSPPASSGSGTAAPPQFKPGQILVLIDAYPDDMPNAKKDAFAKFGQLLGDPNGHVDGILQTSEYPNLLLLGQKPVIPFWLLYVGPFEDTSTANMNCQQLAIQNCRKVYPEGP